MNLRRLVRIAGLLAAVVLLVPSIPYASAPSGPLISPHGFDLSYMDHTCKACDDFYQYAVGNFAKLNPVPADKSYIGSFDSVDERNVAELHTILEGAAYKDNPPAGSVEKQVGDYYAACMDTATIETLGLRPLDQPLGIVNGIKSKADLPAAVAQLQLYNFNAYFGAGNDQDDKNAEAEIFALTQGGLGLPDRDYYVKTDADTQAIRTAYVAHITKIFTLTGSDAAGAAAAAQSVMTTETALAKASSTNVELRDPESNYHVVPIATLRSESKNFDWAAYMSQLGVPPVTYAIVRQPKFFTGLDAVIAGSSLDDIKTYLKWTVLSRYGIVLPKAIDEEDFAFEAKLTGQKEQQPRWKRCVRQTDGGLGEALGRLYVAKAFTPEAKAKALALVNNVQAVLRDDITTLPWMSPATRERAVEKLAAYTKKIGYPDTFRSYPFGVGRATAYDNALASTKFETQRQLAKIGKPIDRTEWGMTPPTVNAYYNPYNNEIVFPAGILQPPFYDPNADDAYNYGGIGMVIGHEMTHGFDDQGSQYDAKGNLKSWWTPEDKKDFDARANCVANYFDTLSVVPGVKQTGKLVEGEAIADLGGATIAYKAYQRTASAKSGKDIDGFTPDQRFFLGFAQIWASNERPELKRLGANTDPHPVDKNRVNATVSNMPQFAAAWHCPMKAPMVRPVADLCKIW
jgi:predicted metalloendopeptidase